MRRCLCQPIETLDRVSAALVVGDCGAHRRIAHDVGLNAAGVHHRQPHRAVAGGKFVVDAVDYLVAVWDGRPAASSGGTADVVVYAEKKGRPVFRIDPTAAGRPAPHGG